MKRIPALFGLMLLSLLCLTVGKVAAQDYPTSSYELDGSTLKKWLGSETEIDFTKDTRLRNIRVIDDSAFKGNTTLRRIVLPPSLLEIGFYVFERCTALEEVTFAESEGSDSYYANAEQYLSLDIYCFENCTKLQKVRFPKYLKSVYAGAFKGCSSLTSFEIDSRHPFLKSSGGVLFTRTKPDTLVLYPPGLTGDYIVPNGVSTIGKGAFYGSELSSVYLPQSVECIKEEAFENAKKLRTINFPNRLREIEHSAFYNCDSLTSFVFPRSLERIGSSAFARCADLPATIKLPDQITDIAGTAFAHNPQVQAYKISPDNPHYRTEDGVLFDADGATLVSFPSGRKSYKVPERVITIGEGAFSSSFIEEIHFTEGLRSIGKEAFFDCELLSTLELPEGFTELGQLSFYGCNALAKITLPSTLEQIGLCAFYLWVSNEKEADALPIRVVRSFISSPPDGNFFKDEYNRKRDTLYVPEESIPLYEIAPGWKDAFVAIRPLLPEPEPIPYELSADGTTLLHWFRSDKVINFTEDEKLSKVRTIGEGAFAHNGNLEQITLSFLTETIAEGAFEQCAKLKRIEAPALIEAKARAFASCTALEAIDFPIIARIGNASFAECTSLETALLPTLCSMEAEVFRGCGALQRVQLSDCLSQIGARAFAFCTALHSLELPCLEPPLLGEEVFAGVPVKNVRLTVPKEAEEKYRNAPQWSEFFTTTSSLLLDVETPSLYYHDGIISISGDGLCDLKVYALDGTPLYIFEGPLPRQLRIGRLPHGIYVVCFGQDKTKIAVL